MNAPEKCPKCGAEIKSVNEYPYHVSTVYACNSLYNSSIGLSQAKDCKKAELPFVTSERDALRAELAALKAERATMVTREVAIAACELREFCLCPECEGDGVLGSTKSCHLITCENCGGDEESEGCGYVQISSEAALARAEAEAGKDGG